MKKISESRQGRQARPGLAVALAWVLATAAMQAGAAGSVKAPPLPPGSSMVRIQSGMNDDEKAREVRAHHNKTHVKKDLNKDDSIGNGQDNQGKKS